MPTKDCKTCDHCTVLYERDRADKFTNAYTPSGFIRCSGPRYKGRTYIRRERQDCPEYERQSRAGAQ